MNADLKVFWMPLGSARVKTTHKYVGEIDPWFSKKPLMSKLHLESQWIFITFKLHQSAFDGRCRGCSMTPIAIVTGHGTRERGWGRGHLLSKKWTWFYSGSILSTYVRGFFEQTGCLANSEQIWSFKCWWNWRWFFIPNGACQQLFALAKKSLVKSTQAVLLILFILSCKI